jgi:hypothetical protein
MADHFLCTISKINVGFFVSERLSALEAVFLPPLVVFVLGVATLWVLRGVRKLKTN